jgi:hypothetical protein
VDRFKRFGMAVEVDEGVANKLNSAMLQKILPFRLLSKTQKSECAEM